VLERVVAEEERALERLDREGGRGDAIAPGNDGNPSGACQQHRLVA
jgi:hypothetical protein